MYQSLYRKWRPDKFSEVKGQEQIVTSLKNQVTHNMVGHAYLFCGTRGTGKTSVAKLFAKTVNCENPVDGVPCCKCASCREIQDNISMDVKEIDAASNNGVDNIRQIKEELAYPPQTGKYRIYIIDEVHMLSTGAFNALLKSLEEPPEYVIFILATTEPQKIPVTISSRCQKYTFKRIPVKTISDRLMEILERENVQAEREAIDYVAKAADGSMRDALSILEKVVMTNIEKNISYKDVLDCLGVIDIDNYLNLFLAIIYRNAEKALDVLNEAFYLGAELKNFIGDMIWFLRTVLILKASPTARADVTEEMAAGLREVAKEVSAAEIIRCINEFSDLLYKQKLYDNKKMFLEISILKLILWEQENTEVLKKEDRDIHNSNVQNSYISDDLNIEKTTHTIEQEKCNHIEKGNHTADKPSVETYPEASGEELSIIRAKWYQFVELLPDCMKEVVRNAGVYPTVDNITLVIDPKDQKAMKFYGENMESFKLYMYAITGRRFKIYVGAL